MNIDLAWKSSVPAQFSAQFFHGRPLGSEVQFQFLTLKLNNRLNLETHWRYSSSLAKIIRRVLSMTRETPQTALFVVIPSAIKVVVWINDNFICTQYNIAKFCWYIRVFSAKQDDITRSSRCWVTASLLSIFLFIDGSKIGLKLLNGQAEASLLCLL